MLKASLFIALDRTGVKLVNVDTLIDHLRDCYPDTPTERITSAIKEGTMGTYGDVYRLSFTQVSIWIKEYEKAIRSKNALLYKT